MLKRISTSDLRVGMYVQEFCGSWMDHPFWRERFLIENEAALKKILECPIREVLIDASKGLDVDVAKEAMSSYEETGDGATKGNSAGAAQRPLGKKEELERAARIFVDSRQVVVAMFGEARLGSMRDIDQATRVVENIAESVARHPMAMIGLARLKSADDYTFMHSIAVSALMVALSQTLGFDEKQTRNAGMAGLLHDVGKAQIPLEILNKPAPLDAKEWETMRSHPERGHRILQDTPGVTAAALDAVLHHHEKVDGSGYPHHLNGDQITQLAKMCAVCDVYDAITSNRPYKAGWQPTVAIRKMTEWADGHFEGLIFKAFVKTVGIYPVGSLVRLESKRLAVVVEHDPRQLFQPTVKAFFSLRSNMHITPTLINLAKKNCGDRIIGFEDPQAHGLTRVDEFWSVPSVNVT